MKLFPNTKKPNTFLWCWLCIWWIVDLIQAGFTELANDEAYYRMFAQDLAWGYFDHPPVTALLVWLGNFLGGEFGVRFFFTLLQPLYLWLLWLCVKPKQATSRDVSLFVLLSAAMPILQLYGFIAVPDGPLMFFTALLLYAYKRFTERNDWGSTLLVGIAIAGLAYSKYQGALVLLLLVLSNVKLLKNPKSYVAVGIAIVLMLPHLIWQYQHDWISFRYHLVSRNRDFQFNFVTEYILNLFAIFNPFLFPVFLKGWWRQRRDRDPVKHALIWISAGFTFFFLTSTLRGYVQPQWNIPVAFGVIAVLFTYGLQSKKLRKYLVWIGWITIILICLVRIEMIFNPLKLKFEVFNNHETNEQLAEIANGAPIIFEGGYTQAAKYTFYTGGEAYGQPSAYGRSNQYELRNDPEHWAGKRVLMEVSDKYPGAKHIQLANGRTFYYWMNPHFTPVERIRIETDPLPATMKIGDTLEIQVEISNPYPYSYSLNGKDTAVVMVWKRTGEPSIGIPLKEITGTLVPGGKLTGTARITVPEVKQKEYIVGFTFTNTPSVTWFNSERYTVVPKK